MLKTIHNCNNTYILHSERRSDSLQFNALKQMFLGLIEESPILATENRQFFFFIWKQNGVMTVNMQYTSMRISESRNLLLKC